METVGELPEAPIPTIVFVGEQVVKPLGEDPEAG